MKLSILIPVGSVHEYFVESIKSVLDDAPLDSEILICATAAVIADAKTQLGNQPMDQRLKFVRSEHGDIVTNLNNGLLIAKGEYIARMDTDDVVIPTRFSKQIAYLDKISNADVVGSYLQYICPHGVDKGMQDYPRRIKRSIFGLASPKVAHPSVMMRRSIVVALGMYSYEYPHVEDLELWLRVLRAGEIHNITQPLLKYRLHPGQISRKKSDEQLKNSLIAFINDSRWIAKLPPIKPGHFNQLAIEDFFLERTKLLQDLNLFTRIFFMVKLQEKYLERFCLGYLHSMPPHKLINEFIQAKTDITVATQIKRNLFGFLLILFKIITRRLIARFTRAGRQISINQKDSTSLCPDCI